MREADAGEINTCSEQGKTCCSAAEPQPKTRRSGGPADCDNKAAASCRTAKAACGHTTSFPLLRQGKFVAPGEEIEDYSYRELFCGGEGEDDGDGLLGCDGEAVEDGGAEAPAADGVFGGGN
jgi:hypothetical protein